MDESFTYKNKLLAGILKNIIGLTLFPNLINQNSDRSSGLNRCLELLGPHQYNVGGKERTENEKKKEESMNGADDYL